MRRLLSAIGAVLLVFALQAAALPSAALAAPPTNDNFAQATVIGGVPYTDLVVATEATAELGEPTGFCSGTPQQTVWYAFTPSSSGIYRASLSGSFTPHVALNMYRQTGTSLGSLAFIGCQFGDQPVVFSATAGVTYYAQAQVQVHFGGPATLQMNLNAVPPPSNDRFAAAAAVGRLPFTDTIDSTAATVEAGEPNICTSPPSEKTAWYVFRPTTTSSVTARVGAGFDVPAVAVYTGDSVNALTQLGCAWFDPLTLRTNAGTTYWFQVGARGGQGGPVQFSLDVAPQLEPAFALSPGDPSNFDTIQFFDTSNDPARMSWSAAWIFGDGSTATGPTPQHRYVRDGTYTARLSITTTDGRTASTDQTIHVATHDVAIVKLAAPQNARVGQTREITVGVRNTRYPEQVSVELHKSNTSGGYDRVGTLTQAVSVNTKGSTPFTFNYTFTGSDAEVGKVTFMTVATTVNSRDALPADNQAVSLATVVRR
jgi:hypothetical protein